MDESGDLGFDFVNAKPLKFFTITVLLVEGIKDNKNISKAVTITLRRKFSKKQKAEELKGSKCPQNIKEYFFKYLTDVNFSIYSIL